MALKDIKGNKKTIERLLKSIQNQTISHAYIFEADGSVDKRNLAENFVKAVLCKEEKNDACDQCICCKKIDHGNHEDVIYVCAEGSSIKNEVIEQLQSRLKKKPYVGDRTIIIVDNADTMTLRAQNRFLKTLEEPTPGTLIILLSENVENLVKTILSRCIVYHLTANGTEDSLGFREGVGYIGDLLLKGTAFYKVTKELEVFMESKETAYGFLDALEGWFRDLMIAPYDEKEILLIQNDKKEEFKNKTYSLEKIYHAIESVEEARKELRQNINVHYALKHMVLENS